MSLNTTMQVVPNRVYEILFDLVPMIVLYVVVMSFIRIFTAIYKKEKIVVYRDIKFLLYTIYCFALFKLVTTTDFESYSNNFIPFKEITRYTTFNSLFIRNVLGNILIFVPFGYLLSDMIQDATEKRFIFPPIALTIITSSTIECIQMFIGRSFDIDDIILNLFGGLIGILIYNVFHRIYFKLPKIFQNEWFKLLLLLLLMVLITSDFIYLYEVLK